MRLSPSDAREVLAAGANRVVGVSRPVVRPSGERANEGIGKRRRRRRGDSEKKRERERDLVCVCVYEGASQSRFSECACCGLSLALVRHPNVQARI